MTSKLKQQGGGQGLASFYLSHKKIGDVPRLRIFLPEIFDPSERVKNLNVDLFFETVSCRYEATKAQGIFEEIPEPLRGLST